MMVEAEIGAEQLDTKEPPALDRQTQESVVPSTSEGAWFCQLPDVGPPARERGSAFALAHQICGDLLQQLSVKTPTVWTLSSACASLLPSTWRIGKAGILEDGFCCIVWQKEPGVSLTVHKNVDIDKKPPLPINR